jgi:hypothetical protein
MLIMLQLIMNTISEEHGGMEDTNLASTLADSACFHKKIERTSCDCLLPPMSDY